MTETLRITLAKITNYKRIREVEIRPDADRNLLLIGGANMQGKSSILDALEVALGGKDLQLADPVRHGADEAVIEVELGGGAMRVKRRVSPDGKSSLEVRGEFGASIKSPQAVLDRIVGARFLDPYAFVRLAAKDQRARLLELVDRDGKIAKLDERRGAAFSRRTEVGRELKKAKAKLDGTPAITPDKPIDVEALVAERQQLADKQRAGDGLGHAHRQAVSERQAAERNLAQCQAQIRELEAKLAKLRADEANLADDVTACAEVEATAKAKLDAAAAEWRQLVPRRDEIDQELARAQTHNRKVATDEAAARQRAQLEAEVGKLEAEHRKLDGVIEDVDRQKLEILEAADLPVPGLGVNELGVTMHGVPLEQASGAEKLRVALAIAVAANSQLRDVWIRDGALLDDDSLAAVAQFAQRSGVNVWIERVGTRDAGAIVIHDGEVAEVTPALAPSSQGTLFG